MDAAEKIRRINSELYAKLADINMAMNALKLRFEEDKNVIESFAKFPVNTAQNCETTESTVRNNASVFK